MARSSDPNGTTPSSGPAGPGDDKASRILVVLPNWVGDVVLATPALRAMREHFAGRHITFLARSQVATVLSGGNWMDEVVCWPTRDQTRPQRRRSFLGFAAELREHRYHMAILLANSFRSALLARLAGIHRRVGYDRDGRGLLLTDKLLPEKANGKFIPVSMIRYYNAVARYLGCRECPELPELFTTPEDEAGAAAAIAAAGAAPGQPVVVLNPGASFGPAKCWLPERFAEVGDHLAERYKAAVFVSCGPREVEVARSVARRMRQRVTVLDNPVMPLGPSKALIRRAALLVTNDTGPRHFANAFGTPVLTVFGPTDPQWTQTGAPRERTVMVSVDCGPCMKRRCPLDHRCMTRITSDMVLARAEELLVAQPAAGARA
jgi:heptosyltransferase-2